MVAYAKQILQENIHEHNDVDKYLEERASCCEIQVLIPEMVTKCHEFLSKQDFLQKCKSIVRGEITEFGGELEGVSVDVVNEGGQLAIDIRTGIFGASGCSDSYDLHENDIETIWNSVVKKIRSYHYQRVLKKLKISGDLPDVISAIQRMLEYQMQQEEEEKEIENLKIAVREIQNLI